MIHAHTVRPLLLHRHTCNHGKPLQSLVRKTLPRRCEDWSVVVPRKTAYAVEEAFLVKLLKLTERIVLA